MQGGTTTPTSASSEADEGFFAHEHIAGLLERMRREPALRAWVLTAPTGALATLGVDPSEILFLGSAAAIPDSASCAAGTRPRRGGP